MTGPAEPRGRAGRGWQFGLAGRFRHDRSGATAVEFALVSVPFLGLLFAIFQTCLAFLMQQGLDVAVGDSARQVLTGQAQSNTAVTTWQTFRDTFLCPAAPANNLLPSYITCSSVVMDVRSYSSFSSVSAANVSSNFMTDGSGPQYKHGGPCDIVVVRAVYPMPLYLPTLQQTSPGSKVTTNMTGVTTYNGKLVQMLTAAAVFRNEPYAASGSGTSSGCGS